MLNPYTGIAKSVGAQSADLRVAYSVLQLPPWGGEAGQ